MTKKSPPPKKMSEKDFHELGMRNSAAIRGITVEEYKKLKCEHGMPVGMGCVSCISEAIRGFKS